VDADVLQRRLVFERDDVVGDGGHQGVEVFRGRAVEPASVKPAQILLGGGGGGGGPGVVVQREGVVLVRDDPPAVLLA